MYCRLGDIIFESLIGFESIQDKRETSYVEHPVIIGKSLLQKTGEKLIEFSGVINFHVGFCNPEEQYRKLNDARIAGKELTFIYGNGFVEGDFVITTLERTINQTDKNGNFVSITCNISLKEFISSNDTALQQERDKTKAFAISSNRPLPANSDVRVDNPSLRAMNSNKEASQAAEKINVASETINNKTNNANTAPPISKAQAFMDNLSVFVNQTNIQLTKCQTTLSSLTALIGLYPKLAIQSPTLTTVIANSNTAISALLSQLTVLGNLPTTISDIPTAQNVLNQAFITTNLVRDFSNSVKELNKASSKIAVALALKMNLK